MYARSEKIHCLSELIPEKPENTMINNSIAVGAGNLGLVSSSGTENVFY